MTTGRINQITTFLQPRLLPQKWAKSEPQPPVPQRATECVLRENNTDCNVIVEKLYPYRTVVIKFRTRQTPEPSTLQRAARSQNRQAPVCHVLVGFSLKQVHRKSIQDSLQTKKLVSLSKAVRQSGFHQRGYHAKWPALHDVSPQVWFHCY